MTWLNEAGIDGRAFAPAAARRTLVHPLAVLERERARWVLFVPVLVGVGIGLYFLMPFEPALGLALAPLLAAVGLRLVFRRGLVVVAATGALLSVGLGFAAAKIRVEIVRAPLVVAPTRAIALSGFVERIEPRLPKGHRLTLRLLSAEGFAPAELPLRVRLRSAFDAVGAEVGDAIAVKAVLTPQPLPARPGGFDFARLAYFDGVGAGGFLIEAPRQLADPPAPGLMFGFALVLEQLRVTVGARIRAALPDANGAVADALVTGERGRIPAETTTALQDSGLAHILAISGFNMAIMAGALFGFTRATLALVPVLALRLPLKKIAALAGFIGAIFCLVISGAASPAARAFVMIALMLLALLLDRPALSMRNLALAALVLLLLAPETLLDAGFQMSFAAVVGLMAVFEWYAGWRAAGSQSDPREKPGLARRALRFGGGIVASTVVAGLAVAPLATFHFQKMSQLGLLANLIAVPLFAFYIMPLVLVALIAMPFGLEAMPLLALDQGVQLMLAVAHAVAGIEGAAARVPQMPLAALVSIMLGGLWLALWRQRWRLLGLVGIGAGLALTPLADRHDIIIGAAGKAVAIRGADGLLAALAGRGGGFETGEWLEADGDGRDVKAATAGAAFTCDAVGCTAPVAGLLLAVGRHPASFADDCARADVLVTQYRTVLPCPRARLVLDADAIAAAGVVAITVSGADRVLHVRSVEAERGNRPWTDRGRSPLRARPDDLDLPAPAVVADPDAAVVDPESAPPNRAPAPGPLGEDQ